MPIRFRIIMTTVPRSCASARAFPPARIPAPCHPPAPPPGGPGQSPGVNGIVDSVTGNTIAVNSIDPTGKTAHTTVNVVDATTYNKHAVTNAQAIQNGKCMAAQGIKDGGVLHAATIDLEPCPPMGRPHHHFHFPWPHHRH